MVKMKSLENVMKNKKFLIIASLIVILAIAFVTCACNPENPDEPNTDNGIVNPDDGTNTDGGDCTITYEGVDGVIFSSSNPKSAKKGESFTFEFSVDVFYTGTPVVKVNNRDKTADYDEENYVYTVNGTVTKDMVVSVSGIEKAVSDMYTASTGEIETPFLINEPIDLLAMAERINSGADNSAMAVLGYYVLENDIDLRGQEIPIIGDGNNNYAFFGGYLNGNGHTISNFKINSDGKDYVGLFGIVQAGYYESLGFTGGTIFNLKLSDYTIAATNTGSTITCGSFVGQGFGATLVLCEAKNATIDVMGDNNYFSYAGGIIGLQRSYQNPYFSKVSYCSTDNVNIVCSSGTTYAAGGISGYVYAEDDSIVSLVTNCYTNGDVTGSFHAGGIVGWLSNYTAVISCYSTGTVHAQSHLTDTVNTEQYCHAYAGGLVGMAQLDSVIADSFATGSVSAHAAAGSSYTHLGEIVGRVEDLEDGLYNAKEMSIFNCYGSNSGIDFTNPENVKTKLGWHDVDWKFENGSYPVVNTVNSYKGEDDETEIVSYSYTVKLNYGGKTDENGKTEYSIEIKDQYEAMTYWYQVFEYGDNAEEGIPATIKTKDGYTSYGYYFDSELTLPVPAGYVPMRNITLYVAFANNSDVAGTYYLVSEYEDNDVELVLNADGTYSCTDVYGSYEGEYVYNGEYVVFTGARFARYYGEGDLENYQAYEFKAVKTANGFEIYGALYSDEDGEVVELVPRDNPLKAIKEDKAIVGSYFLNSGANALIIEFFANGTGIMYSSGDETEFEYTLSEDGSTIDLVAGEDTQTITISGGTFYIYSAPLYKTDAFRGKWEISSLPNKYMEFDGAGNWTYSYVGYKKENNQLFETVLATQEGTYTVSASGDELTLSNGAVVTFTNDGFIEITSADSSYVYGRPDGYFGKWTSQDGSVVLELNGITSAGYGDAKIRYITKDGDITKNEIYYLTYAPDMLIEGQICVFYEGEYYGSIAYNSGNGYLYGSVYSLALSDFATVVLYRTDEYAGEWVGDSLFDIVSFNGYGVYTIFGDVALNGTITIDGSVVNYYLDNFSLSGRFSYGDKTYEMTLDEGRNVITITYVGGNAELARKDALGGKTFVDENGTEYVFDGKGSLASKGTLTVKYANKTNTYSYVVEKDGSVAIYDGDNNVGGIAVEGEVGNRNYALTIGSQKVVLGVKTAFTGSWALESSFDSDLVIGSMNYDNVLVGKVPLTINDKASVYDASFTLTDDGYLVWEVEEGVNLYVVEIAEETFIVSTHLNWFNYDDSDSTEWVYSYAMKADVLRGKWTNNARYQSYVFDGMGKNTEALGTFAVYITGSTTAVDNFYYGYFERVDGSGYDFLIFTEYSTTARSAFKVNMLDKVPTDDEDVYVNEAGDKAFSTESVDLGKYKAFAKNTDTEE